MLQKLSLNPLHFLTLSQRVAPHPRLLHCNHFEVRVYKLSLAIHLFQSLYLLRMHQLLLTTNDHWLLAYVNRLNSLEIYPSWRDRLFGEYSVCCSVSHTCLLADNLSLHGTELHVYSHSIKLMLLTMYLSPVSALLVNYLHQNFELMAGLWF